jgi:hypothetical protein
MTKLAQLCLGCLVWQGCGLDPGVGQPGQYSFVPGAPVVDSTPYPLEHLMVVEEDSASGLALIYLFAGELAAAGLGLQDLRRVALGHLRFQMAFDRPRSRFAQEALADSAGGMRLRVGDADETVLVALDDRGLVQSGASRWLSSVTSDDYAVRAYFAAVEYQGPAPALAVEFESADIGPRTQLPALELTVETGDDGELTLHHGSAEGADYVILELGQPITGKQTPRQPLDALARMTLARGTPLAIGAALLDGLAAQGCWSAERPLQLRVTQVARDYLAQPRGGAAVIHQREDAMAIEPEVWAARGASVEPAAYCADFE